MSILKKFSIRRSFGLRSSLSILGIGLILGGSTLAFAYRSYCRGLEEQITQNATNLATTIASRLDCEELDAYYETGETDEAYWVTRELLLDFHTHNDLAYLVVYKPTQEGFYYIFDTDESDETYPLGYFEEYYYDEFEENKERFLAGESIPPLITDFEEMGVLLSVIEPVKDENGLTHAYVNLDFSMEEILDMEHTFLVKLLRLQGLLTLLLMTLSGIAAWKTLVQPINRLSEAAADFVKRQREGEEKREVMNLPIKTVDELGRLYQSIRQMEIDIYDYIENLTAVTAEKERIGAELNVATQIQTSMLPCIFPPFPGRNEFDIHATMLPAKEVGGDFYDFFLVDDDHLALVIADVSGKGVPAALFMVIAKTLISNSAQTGASPKAVLERVNNQLCENNEADMFVSVWLGVLEISTGKMTCANAGHEYPALCRAGGGFELVSDPHGLVLAVMEGSEYKEYELTLDPGDTLYVFTDGVTEATDAENRLFATERLLEALNKDPTAQPKELLSTVKEGIDAFVGEAPQFDDITMIGFRYNGI